MYILIFLFTLTFSSYCVDKFKLGVENISANLVKKFNLSQKRVGLVTNQTGINQNRTPTVSVLRKKGVNISTLFAPEHGYCGTVSAGKSVENTIDPLTKLPIVSLFSHEKGLVGRTINGEKINTIDVLIFDMQDSGMRHYTYISTLMRCLQAAQEYQKPLIVLDRPNPLGSNMEGPLVESDLISFISIASIPLRHGMTIGELAWHFNKYVLKKPADLHVILMSNYTRDMDVTHILQAPLSPNLPTAHAVHGYSFLGLLGEVKPFDIGVGTKHAFQCIMLPKKEHISCSVWKKAQKLLAQHDIASKKYATFSKRKKEQQEGLLLHIKDINKVRSFPLFLNLVSLFKHNGLSANFAPTFDKAVGNSIVRTALQNNTYPLSLCGTVNNALQQFHAKAKKDFLYIPHPVIAH